MEQPFTIRYYGASYTGHSLVSKGTYEFIPKPEHTEDKFGPVKILVKDGIWLKDPIIIPVQQDATH